MVRLPSRSRGGRLVLIPGTTSLSWRRGAAVRAAGLPAGNGMSTKRYWHFHSLDLDLDKGIGIFKVSISISFKGLAFQSLDLDLDYEIGIFKVSISILIKGLTFLKSRSRS